MDLRFQGKSIFLYEEFELGLVELISKSLNLMHTKSTKTKIIKSMKRSNEFVSHFLTKSPDFYFIFIFFLKKG